MDYCRLNKGISQMESVLQSIWLDHFQFFALWKCISIAPERIVRVCIGLHCRQIIMLSLFIVFISFYFIFRLTVNVRWQRNTFVHTIYLYSLRLCIHIGPTCNVLRMKGGDIIIATVHNAAQHAGQASDFNDSLKKNSSTDPMTLYESYGNIIPRFCATRIAQ